MVYTPVTVDLNGLALNGTTASPAGVIWEWIDLAGWFDTADQRFQTEENALGVSVTVDRRNQRTMTLTAFCHSTSAGMKLDDLMYAAQKVLKAAVAPSVDIPVLLKVNEPDVALQAYVRQAGPIRSRMWGTRHGCLLQVPLTAPDFRRYKQTASSDLANAAGTAPVVVGGDVPTPGVFTITGGTNPQVRNLSLSGNPQVVYGGTLGGGDVVVIDMAAQTVTLNAVDARENLTIAHWWQFKPGTNSIQTVGTSTDMAWRDAYS